MWDYVILACACLCAAFIFLVEPTYAHDHWINHGDYRDPVTKQHCCGAKDCHTLPVGSYIETPSGWYIPSVNQTVAYARGIPSEDGHAYICQYGGTNEVRCFFFPVGGV